MILKYLNKITNKLENINFGVIPVGMIFGIVFSIITFFVDKIEINKKFKIFIN